VAWSRGTRIAIFTVAIILGLGAALATGTGAAVYFGLLDYSSSSPKSALPEVVQRLPELPVAQPGPGQFVPNQPPPRRVPLDRIALPPRDAAAEARKEAERAQRVQERAASEGPIVAALGASNAARDAISGELALWQQDDPVRHVAFTPNSQLLAAIDADGTVKVWDLRTGTVKHALADHSRSGAQVAFSPDGRTLAANAANGKVRLWDVQTGKLQRELTAPFNQVEGVMFSPDGQRVLAGGLRLWQWDANTGAEIPHKLSDHVGFTHFALSPNGKMLAIAEPAPSEVQFWELETGKCYNVTFSTVDPIMLAFSPDGWTLAILDKDPRSAPLKLSILGRREPFQNLMHPRSLSAMAYSPDGKWLALGGYIGNHGTLQLWEVAGNQGPPRLTGDNLGYVDQVVFSPGGNLLATVHSETIRIWEVSRLLAGGGPKK
jgi:WD40 repeat protein